MEDSQSFDHDDLSDAAEERAEPGAAAVPLLGPVSGLYELRTHLPHLDPAGASPVRWVVQQLRLDVDGRYPQMTASGTHSGSGKRVHWIAKLAASGSGWSGPIWFKDGDVGLLPYTSVKIAVSGLPIGSRSATVRFLGAGVPVTVRLPFRSRYFHPVDFEFDSAEGEAPTLSIDTSAHPNRPPALPSENLSIQTVYRRAGFGVTTSPGGPVPIAGAGADALWSDMELHDALQTYWSRFAAKAQWAMWVFFASLHEADPPSIPTPQDLGGVMFDDIGPNHRQGTSIFNDAFISVAPAGDPAPAAWVQRMIFWTACHEMGHAFNLAHSWQKAAVSGGHGPWIPLANAPEARSFMNYPYRVAGGQTAFFADFEFRFSDNELVFLRHAPERFVQQGNAAWFDHHGFEDVEADGDASFRVDLRVNRDVARFEFLEPVTVEIKLSNVSTEPTLVDENLLASADAMTVVLKKDRGAARQWIPFAQYCWRPRKRVLEPGASLYAALPIFAGRNGWDVSEPGNYTIQAAVHVGTQTVVSNALRVRVEPPGGYEEERLASDILTEDVGRAFAFNGTRVLRGATDALAEATAKLGDRRIAKHAALILGQSEMRDYKRLVAATGDEAVPLRFEREAAVPDDARPLLDDALLTEPNTMAESLGHIRFKAHVDQYSDWTAAQGDVAEPQRAQDTLLQTLAARQVRGRPVLPEVLAEIEAKRNSYAGAAE